MKDWKEKREDINVRFLDAIDRMSGNGPSALFKDDSDFCRKIGLRPQTMSNIRNSKTHKVSLQMLVGLQMLCGPTFDIRELFLDDFEYRGLNIPDGYQLIKTSKLSGIKSLSEKIAIDLEDTIKKERLY